MTINKRKKVTRYRASTTHGGGHRKKRRGAGNRGGRGRAGSGKRAGTNKQSRTITGRQGFSPRGSKKPVKAINISDLQTKFIACGKIEKKGDVYIVDLHKLGYDKLLGSGNISAAIEVIGAVSKNAAEKVKKAGGKVAGEEE